MVRKTDKARKVFCCEFLMPNPQTTATFNKAVQEGRICNPANVNEADCIRKYCKFFGESYHPRIDHMCEASSAHKNFEQDRWKIFSPLPLAQTSKQALNLARDYDAAATDDPAAYALNDEATYMARESLGLRCGIKRGDLNSEEIFYHDETVMTENDALKREIEELKKQLADQSDSFSKLHGVVAAQNEKLEKKLKKSKNKEKSLAATNRTLTEANNKLTEDNNSLLASNGTLADEVESLKSANADLKRQVANAATERQEAVDEERKRGNDNVKAAIQQERTRHNNNGGKKKRQKRG